MEPELAVQIQAEINADLDFIYTETEQKINILEEEVFVESSTIVVEEPMKMDEEFDDEYYEEFDDENDESYSEESDFDDFEYDENNWEESYFNY